MHLSTDMSGYAAELRGIIESTPWNRATGSLADFNELALRLFRLQFLGNHPYRRVCETLERTPAVVGEWMDIPAMPTGAFKELHLTSLSEAERTRVFHSSGTTGQQPSRHWHGPESLALYESSLWNWFLPHLLPDFETGGQVRLISMTPPPHAAPHSSLVHMAGHIAARLGQGMESFFGIVGSDGWGVDSIGLIRAFDEATLCRRPVLLIGTAFQFVEWTDFCAAESLQFELPPGSRVMETGGYKGRSRELAKDELHERISQCAGVRRSSIVCEYGMSELGAQAYDTAWSASHHGQSDERRFQFAPWARSVVISTETEEEVEDGRTGMLRVLDLTNVWSVAAVQTSDLAIRSGRGFQLVGRATATEPRGCSLMTAVG